MRIAPDLLHGLSTSRVTKSGKSGPCLVQLRRLREVARHRRALDAVVARVGHVVGAAVLDDAGVLAAAGQLVGLGGDQDGLAAALEVHAVGGGGEADRGAAVRPLGAVEQVDQPVADDRGGVEDELRLPRLGAGAQDRVGLVARERAERIGDRKTAAVAAAVRARSRGRCGGAGGERGGRAELDEVSACRSGHAPTRTQRGAAQPGYGGASPQPQRGTGASGGGSAPGCELASAIRVPHST